MTLKILSQDQISAAPRGGCAAGSCGSTGNPLSPLSENIRRRVHNHPCYSERAHHYYARMHVAVAPACNMQCHYCNRKFDCANESRPGVVSELLTPEQAVQKAVAVAANIPQMTVLGIAGPGDPLANPEHTFATFRMLSARAPDIKLCLSTNGLMLPKYVEELVRLNIGHVTITINCVDPEVGARIYPWIFWNHRRIRGREGVRILVEQQQKGLNMLVERGILVKVNSVLIPGVNDKHLREVSRVVRQKGAFLHNIMPLISEAAHGTFYGTTGQRGPTHVELNTLQDACGGDMKMMRHCRQCRADAVGLLGEDRGAEFTMDKVNTMKIDDQAAMAERSRVRATIEKILAIREAASAQSHTVPSAPLLPHKKTRPVLMAVAATGGGMINQHFGRAKEFLVYEASPDGVRFVGHRKAGQYCFGTESCGESDAVMTETIRALEGCEAILCARIGYDPWRRLEEAGIQPNGEHAMEPVEDAVMAVYQEMTACGKLDEKGVGIQASA